MSPFSLLLKEFRVSRGLKQIEMADLLGYEPSYLSALERSEKGPPRQDFTRRLIRGLQLNDDEQNRLAEALRDSCRQISLPARASVQEYQIFGRLRGQWGSLHPLQLELLDIVSRIPEAMSQEFRGKGPSVGRRSAIAEVPKM